MVGTALRGTRAPPTFATALATLVGGTTVVAAGATLASAGIVQMRRARTTIVPHRPVAVLRTSCTYLISRNPMYTGLAIAFLGTVLLAGTWWLLFAGLRALLAIWALVIGPEERHLTARFGQAYLNYRAYQALARSSSDVRKPPTRPASRGATYLRAAMDDVPSLDHHCFGYHDPLLRKRNGFAARPRATWSDRRSRCEAAMESRCGRRS